MKKIISSLSVSLALVGLLVAPLAVAAPAPTGPVASGGATTNEAARLALIKSRGDSEIQRRLTSLGKLTDKVNDSKKLSATNKTALNAQISTEVTGLNSLKTQLDATTTLADAHTAAASIFSDYRVYALIVPKVWLINTADRQQANEDRFTVLISKLQTRLDAAKAKGKDVTTLQTQLTTLQTEVAAAQAISSSVEQKVAPLVPSDYNSDHTLLSGYLTQLQQAHASLKTAYSDARAIISSLKTL